MPDANLRALTSLRRLRKLETDAARRDLAEALAAETALTARDGAVAAELDVARRMTGDFDRDAFAAWFGRMRAERARLAEALRAAEARIAAVRVALAGRRVAETAAEETLAREIAALAAVAEGRDQVMLEDAARAITRATRR